MVQNVLNHVGSERTDDGVAELRPHLEGPRPEVAVRQRHTGHARIRVDPQERPATAEVSERARRVRVARPVRSLVSLDLEGQAKRVRVHPADARQHPPEVTGFFALQAFLEELIKSPLLDDFLDQYSILVYPLLNPDGVDMGHWRHNAGGVDLNRDWAYYRQPETRQVADHIVKMQYESGGKVMLGLDFHSTWEDVFYTQDKKEQLTPLTPWFREQWFAALEAGLPGYKVNEKPKGLATPVTKGWFYSQFKSEGMTYEIGDDTHRDTIQLIGKITSGAMMQILLDHSSK